jgi:hypothetical protein
VRERLVEESAVTELVGQQAFHTCRGFRAVGDEARSRDMDGRGGARRGWRRRWSRRPALAGPCAPASWIVAGGCLWQCGGLGDFKGRVTRPHPPRPHLRLPPLADDRTGSIGPRAVFQRFLKNSCLENNMTLQKLDVAIRR